jgi:IS6 family transposase
LISCWLQIVIWSCETLFQKALSSSPNQLPRVITVDKNTAYPPAIQQLINENVLFD